MENSPNPARLGTAIKKLNQAQKEAVEYLSGPLLVLAGPGTGKTQLLSTKVAYILENTDLSPENILCITFTENAATNMRERIASIIGPTPASNVNIHTYHAFGATILNEYQNFSATPTRRFDNSINDVAQRKILIDLRKELPTFDILKNDFNTDGDILATISEAKSHRLSPSDLLKIAEDNLSDTVKVNQICTPLLSLANSNYDQTVTTVYQPILEQLLPLTSPTPITKNIEKEVNILAKDLKSALDTEDYTKTGKRSVKPLTNWRTKYFGKDENNNFIRKNTVANKKLISLAKLYQSYQNYLSENGLYDYADMIEYAAEILRTDNAFRLSLAERYQYILLDEFQDTNPSQFELVRIIAGADNPDIMAVGDDDQAIFEFQGANASNLIDFQNTYNAHVITLTENYRSTAEILDFSEKIRLQITDSFAATQNINKHLTANISGPGEITRHEFLVSPAEYHWVAEDIKNKLKSGVSANDIAIICPEHNYITPLLPHLKSQNINVSYTKRDNVLENPKIKELIVLSRFIYALANNQPSSHYLPEILAFPFWNLSHLSVLLALKTAKEAHSDLFKSLCETEDDNLKRVLTFLADLAAISFETPLELFLDYLLGLSSLNDFTSPYLSFYQGLEDFKTYELYEHLSILRSHLSSYLQTPTPKLSDFVKFANDYEEVSQPITSSIIYRDSADSVDILTIHGAKGLEYEYIYLIAVDNNLWGKSSGNRNKLSLPANLTPIRHTGSSESEQLRKLFVAITRAKHYLIMTNSLHHDLAENNDIPRLLYLAESAQDGAILSPYIPSGSVTIHHNTPTAELRTELARLDWLSVYTPSHSPSLKNFLSEKLSHYRLTATDLTKFIDIVYAGPRDVYQKILGAPSEPPTENIILGNIIHQIFEEITTNGLSDAAALTLLEQKVLEQPLTPEEQKHLLERATLSLEKSLIEFKDILRSPSAKAEVNLYHENISAAGIPITGKIDHININDKEKTIELYDFKTGAYSPQKWNTKTNLYKYALQLSFYKLLLNNSPTFKKYEVKTGHILYVTPKSEEDLAVHDKPYHFDTISDQTLLELIKAVYHHITTLDFLNDPSLNIESDKSRKLKDILNFIELMLAIKP